MRKVRQAFCHSGKLRVGSIWSSGSHSSWEISLGCSFGDLRGSFKFGEEEDDGFDDVEAGM